MQTSIKLSICSIRTSVREMINWFTQAIACDLKQIIPVTFCKYNDLLHAVPKVTNSYKNSNKKCQTETYTGSREIGSGFFRNPDIR